MRKGNVAKDRALERSLEENFWENSVAHNDRYAFYNVRCNFVVPVNFELPSRSRNTFPTDPWTFRFDALLLRVIHCPQLFSIIGEIRLKPTLAVVSKRKSLQKCHRMFTISQCFYLIGLSLQILTKILMDTRLIHENACAIEEKRARGFNVRRRWK